MFCFCYILGEKNRGRAIADSMPISILKISRTRVDKPKSCVLLFLFHTLDNTLSFCLFYLGCFYVPNVYGLLSVPLPPVTLMPDFSLNTGRRPAVALIDSVLP